MDRGDMSAALILYLALTATLAAWILTHAALVIGVLSRRGLRPGRRALALLPPATPVLAWQGGVRLGVVLWGALMAIYLGLQVVAQGWAPA